MIFFLSAIRRGILSALHGFSSCYTENHTVLQLRAAATSLISRLYPSARYQQSIAAIVVRVMASLLPAPPPLTQPCPPRCLPLHWPNLPGPACSHDRCRPPRSSRQRLPAATHGRDHQASESSAAVGQSQSTPLAIEGLSKEFCDDFTCSSSPAVENTMRILSRDIQRRGVTRSLYAPSVQYRVRAQPSMFTIPPCRTVTPQVCKHIVQAKVDWTVNPDGGHAVVRRIHSGHSGVQTATSGSPGCQTASATRERCVADRAP